MTSPTVPGEVKHRWTVLPHLLLRRAGFPMALLADVADPGLVSVAEDLVHAIGRWERLRRSALHETAPVAVESARADPDPARVKQQLRALSAWRSALGRRVVRPIPHEALSAVVQQLQNRASAITDLTAHLVNLTAKAEHRERTAIVAALADPRARLAVVQLSPSFAFQLERSDERAWKTAMVNRGYLFLQRLSAKNETTSFFGPIGHGHVDYDTRGLHTSCSPDTDSVCAREAFLSFWAARELSAAIGADPLVAERCPVRRNPLVASTPDGVRLPDGREIRLSAADRALFESADGVLDAASLAAATGYEEARTRVRRLVKAGVLLADVEPASARLRPLDELRHTVQKIVPQSPWAARLEAVARRVEAYGRTTNAKDRAEVLAGLEELFTSLTGRPARRLGGATYADRHVVYEECHGDDDLVVGADVAADWQAQLAPYLQWCAEYGWRRQQAMWKLADVALASSGGKLSFLTFADRLSAAVDAGELRAHRGPVDDFEAKWHALVAAGTHEGIARVDPAALPEAGASGPVPRFVSPDLLVGNGSTVVGELHPYVFAWGSQQLFAPDPDGLRACFEANLDPWGGPARVAMVLRRRQHKGILSDVFPGTFIEVGGVATGERKRCIPVADLWVEAGADGPCLHGPDGSLVLYTGEEDHPHLLALSATPVVAMRCRFGAGAPRVLVGDLVVQRARWWLDRGSLEPLATAADAARRLRLACGLRGELGLPRWVFVKAAGEVKPVSVDLCSVVAVNVLAGLAAKTLRSGADELMVEEMLPEPDDLWLRRQVGGRRAAFTSEIRLALIREAS